MSKLSEQSLLYFAAQPAGFIAVRKHTGSDVTAKLRQFVVKGYVVVAYENKHEACYKITAHGKAELLIMQIRRRLVLGLPVDRLQAQLALISTEKV